MNRHDRIEKDPEPCSKSGVYCTRCRFRMLPSLAPYNGDKTYYCVPCRSGIGIKTGIVFTLLALVKREVVAA